MNDNISPEEKLLRLIRNDKKPPAGLEKTAPLPLQETPQDTPKAARFSVRARPEFFLNLRRSVIAIFVASLLFLAATFIYSLFGLKKIKLPLISSNERTELPKINREIIPLETYLKDIDNRHIFSASSARDTQAPANNENLDFLKKINLVGIILGENPQAVIEDKTIQKTYYLSTGQFIGGFQIEDIQEGKIILKYNGQRFELYL